MTRRRKEKIHAECQACGESFEQKRRTQKFCRPACRNKAWAEDHRPPVAAAQRVKAAPSPREVLRAYWRAEWKRNGPARRARRREQKSAPPG